MLEAHLGDGLRALMAFPRGVCVMWGAVRLSACRQPLLRTTLRWMDLEARCSSQQSTCELTVIPWQCVLK